MLTSVVLRTRFFMIVFGLSILVVSGLYANKGLYEDSKSQDNNNSFTHLIVDDSGPNQPWGKAVGDINGDGLPDLIIGGHSPRELKFLERIKKKLHLGKIKNSESELVWYKNPAWQKHLIASKRSFSTDHEVVDLDSDGHNDVLSITSKELLWFKNPDWSEKIIDDIQLHDIEAGDLNGDGRIDIIARNQSAFSGNGDRLFVYMQNENTTWDKYSMSCPNGEGLRIADLNSDGRLDIVVNNQWYENTGGMDGQWQPHVYSKTWAWDHTVVDVGDINDDGRLDVVLTPAEKAGEAYHISWFEAPVDHINEFREHIVDPKVETVHHSVATADIDLDGDIDIVTAEMHQGEDPDEIKCYLNLGDGTSWEKIVIGRNGSHNIKLLDVDGDGDMDLFGANWSGPYQPIELWANQLRSWKRHVIDGEKPWRSVFVDSADIDGDGYKDIITGGWWYGNPKQINGNWKRHTFGPPANNMAAVHDFDDDGDVDVLATGGQDNPASNIFTWAQNNGNGLFDILKNIAPAEGDFLQGVVVGEFQPGEFNIMLSWHAGNQGIQMLTVPKSPQSEIWHWQRVSKVSQDEEISAGDIDRDGDLDLLLGTKWLRNDAGEWSEFLVYETTSKPDRNRLVDMNGDGRLDAVIGYEAISKNGKIAWYEQRSTPTVLWTEHIIGYCVGPMSLDVVDMDQDGDFDVVVGEHNLVRPSEASMIIFENHQGNASSWRKQVVYLGDEHHDGAHVVDIDKDGDNDIVSIGWGHRKVVLYENKSQDSFTDTKAGRPE